MAQRSLVVTELKRILKEQSITYVMTAKHLGVSLATIKRWFSQSELSLERLDQLCELAGVEMSDVLERVQKHHAPTVKLTVAQEQEIIADAKLFLVTWLVLSRTSIKDILTEYALSERELQRCLIRLDRLKVIELQPGNRARLLVSQRFSWRTGGPVQRFIHDRLLREFLSASFSNDTDEFIFHGGAVSNHGMARLKRVMQNAARDCAEIIDHDKDTKGATGAAFVMALRPWQYSGFARFMKDP